MFTKLSIKAKYLMIMMLTIFCAEAHPLYLGCCALSAKDYVHVCIEKADLIINIGHDVVEKPPFFMQYVTRLAKIILWLSKKLL
jgi:TPP-dependent 2-oxoacid decarboxylase